MKLKILTALLATSLMTTSVMADKVDDVMKKQCQYIVYGNGENNDVYNYYLTGVVVGLAFPIQDRTELYKKADYGVIQDKACQNALNNTGVYGFISDFKVETLRLISKKYAAM